jgi:hypothetical protein
MATHSTKRKAWWLLAIVVTVGVAAVGIHLQEPSVPSKAETLAMQDLRAAAHLANRLRQNMNNPDSFILVSAGISTAGGVCITYRGTNSFNAVVTSQAVIPSRTSQYHYTPEGDRKAFEKAWREGCQSSPVRDETRMVKRLMS